MAIELKEILIDIATKTYGKAPEPFRLEMIAEERKTFHGQYWAQRKLIQIYNLSRPVEYIVATTIHELAHHIDYSENGESGHNQRFYKILKELLETAVRAGYVKYDVIVQKTDSADLKQMEKYWGRITTVYDADADSNKDFVIIKVFNCFDIKDMLKNRGYKYDATEKAWQKKMLNLEAEAEKKEIEKMSNCANVKLMSFSDIQISAPYYIVVSGSTYQYKDILKANGFFFNSSGNPAKTWIKRIKASEMDAETEVLKKEKIPYKIKSKINVGNSRK